MLKGFKNFLMRGDVVVVAVGLVVALAFSMLITAFTNFIINPILAAFSGGNGAGLGWWLTKHHDVAHKTTFLDLGSFISAIIYFAIYIAVIYFVIVLPYKSIMRRRGRVVFGDPAPTQTCPACLSDDLPVGATKCKYCATEITRPATTE